MRKVVVTGGAGFIGSMLVRLLVERGDARVHVVDNLLSGKLSNLEDVRDRIAFHNADIRRYNSISPLLEGADVVFHLAAIPSVPRSINDPVPSHDININGTFEVLRAAKDGGVRRVIYAGSSSAYGDSEVLPKVESMAPNPKSPYALQKLTGEYYCSVFASCYGMEAVTIRYFNVFGPRQDPGSPYSGVLSIFMKCLLERRAPVIHGDGEQSRDFTYVEDVAALTLSVADTAGMSGRVFNGGNGERYTLNYIWEFLQKTEGICLPAEYGPAREGDVRHSQASIESLRKAVPYRPRFTFEEGLLRTLEWYRKQTPIPASALIK